MARERFAVMLGTDLRSPGGITAVVQAYRDVGLFDDGTVRYLATYHRPGVIDRIWTALAAYVRFVAWLVTGRVALVHAHMAARGSFWRKSLFLLTGAAMGARTVLHLHDGSFPSWLDRRPTIVRRLVRSMFERADRVLVLTAGWSAPVLRWAPRARVTVLHNPVLIPPRPKVPDELTVLFMARLWPDKGIDALLQAVALLPPELRPARLICAGDGDLARVRALARRLVLDDVLELPGWVQGSQKDRLLAAASIFVLPSHFEGLPIGVLEAMACGVPVVATDVGGIPEAVGDSAGLLVRPGDVAGLAAALAALIGDPAARIRMGDAGRTRAERFFAANGIVAQLRNIHAELGAGVPPSVALE